MGKPSVLMRADQTLVAEIDAEAEARGVACRTVADRVIELGLQALRAEEGHLAANLPTQGALMAI